MMKIFFNPFKKKGDSLFDCPYIGGDGLSIKTPVGINCLNMHRAESLIEKFISEKHGRKNVDWEMGVSIVFRSSKAKCGYVMNTLVKTKDEEKHYYFDLSRPILDGDRSVVGQHE